MRNCVSGYASRVAGGECFIYRVLEPERCTLAIDVGPHGRFRIMQIHTARNGPVRYATQQLVQRWLNGATQAPGAVARPRDTAPLAREEPRPRNLFDDDADEVQGQEAPCPF
jgi:hypothetical protein